MGLFKKKEKKLPIVIKCLFCDFTTSDYSTLKRHTDWKHPKGVK